MVPWEQEQGSWERRAASPAARAAARPFLSARSHPCPAPPLSRLHTGCRLHCSLRPAASVRPGPAQAPQPATSSEAAARPHEQLLRAVGRPALRPSGLRARAPGSHRPALGSGPFSLGRRGSSPAPLFRGSDRQWVLRFIGRCLLCHLQLPLPCRSIVGAGAISSRKGGLGRGPRPPLEGVRGGAAFARGTQASGGHPS